MAAFDLKAFKAGLIRLQPKGHNINKVEIDVTLDNLKDFKEYWT